MWRLVAVNRGQATENELCNKVPCKSARLAKKSFGIKGLKYLQAV